MVHLSSSEHYEEVQRRLEKWDAIFFEGVKGKKVSLLAFSYRAIARFEEINALRRIKHCVSQLAA